MIRRCFLRAAFAAAVVASDTKRLFATAWKYPPRGSIWSGCHSWKHLAYASAHRGKFDPEWLQMLSYQELQWLHSDDHEHRLHREYLNLIPIPESELPESELVLPTPKWAVPKKYYHQRNLSPTCNRLI